MSLRSGKWLLPKKCNETYHFDEIKNFVIVHWKYRAVSTITLGNALIPKAYSFSFFKADMGKQAYDFADHTKIFLKKPSLE